MPDIFVENTKNATPKSVQENETKSSPQVKTAEEKIPHQMRLLSSIAKDPEGVSFANQDTNEHIVLFLRKHFATNIRWIIGSLLLLLIPLLLYLLSVQFALVLTPFPENYLTLLLLLYYTGILGFALFHFIMWFYNVGIITNKQVIDVNYTSLTTKDVSSATYESVEETRYIQKGFLASFFNFGNVSILTDTPTENIDFSTIPKPDLVADIIQSLKEAATHG